MNEFLQNAYMHLREGNSIRPLQEGGLIKDMDERLTRIEQALESLLRRADQVECNQGETAKAVASYLKERQHRSRFFIPAPPADDF
jgi:hypothetical protein